MQPTTTFTLKGSKFAQCNQTGTPSSQLLLIAQVCNAISLSLVAVLAQNMLQVHRVCHGAQHEDLQRIQ